MTTQQFQIQFDQNLLTKFFTEALFARGNRRSEIRQALSDAFKRYQEYVGSGAEIKVEAAAFDHLASEYTRLFDKYEEEREKKAVPVGGGVYVDVVRDDDYRDITKGES
jgi:hypothetical protein